MWHEVALRWPVPLSRRVKVPLKGPQGEIGPHKGCSRLDPRELPMGPSYGPSPSLKGSELWAPVLEVVHDGVIMGLHKGFGLRNLVWDIG